MDSILRQASDLFRNASSIGMNSIHSMAALGLASSQAFMGNPKLETAASCVSPSLSCQNTTAVSNLCCFNAPGGQLLQTQFWDYNPPTGPADSWTLHGLWPDHCDGTFDQFCDTSREYTNITAILQSFGQDQLLTYMNTYWKDYQGDDETFWSHEWGKHATCISTLSESCYDDYQPQQEVVDFFNTAVKLFQPLTTYTFLETAGITPDATKEYKLDDINAALAAGHGGHDAVVQCKSGAIQEVWYAFNVRGSVQSGQWVSVDADGASSNCPQMVKYLPKTEGDGTAKTEELK